MTSPFTGGEVTIGCDNTTITYRGEAFSCHRYYYRCVDTGIEFTDAGLDDKGLSEVYAQYRRIHGIPSPESLSSLREMVGLPARTMSIMLGLGENQYRLYESGEMPSESIGKMLATLFIPDVMESYIKSSRRLFTPLKYDQALTALHHEREATYHVDMEYSSINRMVDAPARSSVTKSSKSRWSNTKDSISYDNLGMLSPIM